MKKGKFLLLIGLVLIMAIAIKPLLNHANPLLSNQRISSAKTKKVEHKNHYYSKSTWVYPFEKLNEKKINFKSGQRFGETDILRRPKSNSYFHDGYDFGFSEVGHSPVFAIHEGTVEKVKFRPGMGLYVWIISKDGYVEVYQEGFLNDTDIYVKKGQHVDLGQKIGRLTGSHIHLGVTKTDKDYIDKHGDPCKNWYKNNGTWLNPMSIINNNLQKAGKFHQ